MAWASDLSGLMAGAQAIPQVDIPQIMQAGSAAMSGINQGIKNRQEDWQNQGVRFLQQAVKSSTHNGQTDWNNLSQIMGNSDYAGMGQDYARQLLAARVSTAADIAKQRAGMSLFGVDEAKMEAPPNWASQPINQGQPKQPQQPPSTPDSNASAQYPITASQLANGHASPDDTAVASRQQAKRLASSDTTGFVTPEMSASMQQQTGYDLNKTGVQDVSGASPEGASATGVDLQPVAPPDISQAPSGDTSQAAEQAAQPANWLGDISQAQADPFAVLRMVKAQGGMSQTKAADIDALGPSGKRERAIALANNGFLRVPLPQATSQDIADAENANKNASFMGAIGKVIDLNDPLKMASGAAGVAAGAPAMGAGVVQGETEGGRQAEAQRLGIAGSQFGLDKNRTEFAQEQAAIKDLKQYGVDANAANAGTIVPLVGSVKALHASSTAAKSLLQNPKQLNSMSNDELAATLITTLQSINNAEGAGTESQRGAIGSIFRGQKSAGALVQAAEGPADLFVSTLKNEAATMDRVTLMKQIANVSDDLAKRGLARNKLDAYAPDGRANFSWEHWSDRPINNHSRGVVR